MLTFLDDGGAVTAQSTRRRSAPEAVCRSCASGTVTNNTGTSFHSPISFFRRPFRTGVLHGRDQRSESNRERYGDPNAAGVRVGVSFTGAGTGAVTTVWEALSAGATEHYLSGSSAAHVDLRGWIRAWRPGKEGNHVEEYCKNQAEVATPFYLSSGGYGFYAETTNVGRFSFPGANPAAADGPNCANTPSVPSGTTAPLACPFNTAIKSDRVQICLRGAQLATIVLPARRWIRRRATTRLSGCRCSRRPRNTDCGNGASGTPRPRWLAT
jgi:hypothetical protein